MSVQLLSIAVLVVVFVISTVFNVHMGALAFVATFVVGIGLTDLSEKEIIAGFPAGLFVILVGVTYLFAIAKANGAIDWLVDTAVTLVRGRVWAFPWIMFALAAGLAGVGAVPPAAVAIIAPTAMRIAHRYGISPLLMGLMVANGVSAGEFSPIGLFGIIVNDVAVSNGVTSSPILLFASCFAVNAIMCYVLCAVINRRARRHDKTDDSIGTGGPTPPRGGSSVRVVDADVAVAVRPPITRSIAATLAGLLVMVGIVACTELDIGFVAMTLAVILSVLSPDAAKEALPKIAWPSVFLIVGIVTYVGLLQELGTVTYVSDAVAHLQSPLLIALLICVIGAVVSAFASTTGILGALVPLAVPFLLSGEVSSIAMIIALSLSSSIVDASPFSTSGALIVANAAEEDRDRVMSHLLRWGMSMIVVAPVLSWAVFVLPGW
ncbi:SLC13 family permease [Mycolicibacterium smegmatis]|uniref:SLC13 family permease n=1 Tax=Mycolicibacterium smegmatis TaxID=1772 RepID=UPI0020A2EC48|nr:SLC13 family permease [Mycolicibacterium smegmatis]MCP2628232.1 SLC13 family permease [Mycolicibacterium smegmatis]